MKVIKEIKESRSGRQIPVKGNPFITRNRSRFRFLDSLNQFKVDVEWKIWINALKQLMVLRCTQLYILVKENQVMV